MLKEALGSIKIGPKKPTSMGQVLNRVIPVKLRLWRHVVLLCGGVDVKKLAGNFSVAWEVSGLVALLL